MPGHVTTSAEEVSGGKDRRHCKDQVNWFTRNGYNMQPSLLRSQSHHSARMGAMPLRSRVVDLARLNAAFSSSNPRRANERTKRIKSGFEALQLLMVRKCGIEVKGSIVPAYWLSPLAMARVHATYRIQEGEAKSGERGRGRGRGEGALICRPRPLQRRWAVN